MYARLWVALCALLLVALPSAGCTSGYHPSAVSVTASTPAVASLLGAPSNVSLVLRPSALMSDPYWGPPMQRALAKPSVEEPDEVPRSVYAPLLRASQMDVYAAIRNPQHLAERKSDEMTAEDIGYVYVVHGTSGVDPLSFVTRRGERMFLPPVRLASGVLEYPPNPAFARRKRGLASWLFVTPNGTWVGVDQLTVARAHAVFWQTTSAPPPMELPSHGLFSAFADQAALSTCSSRYDSSADSEYRRGMTGGGLVVIGGRSGAIEAVVDYATEDDAVRVERWAKSKLEETCRQNEIACEMIKVIVRDVQVSRDDKRVGVRFTFTDLVLRKLSETK
jgi:hypothetical protein